MSRDPRYDILFEPMDIGPVTAKNRFFQVPHCNGGGYRDPSAAAQMRNSKAEGGWGVIFTEQVEMHHTSEITPFIELRLWDDKDIPMLAKMADQIHEYDALAGLELTYSGINGPNLYTKEVPRGPSAGPILTFTSDPVSARAMDKQDIKDLRRWYRNAFIRSKEAGYDLVCLYGAHGFGIIQHFLSRATNHRTDEYGGSLENRSRLMRELIEEGKDAVGDTVGISVRLSLNEILGEHGFSNAELRDCIEMNAEVPDLWDLAHGSWEDCSETSRFGEEGAQQPLVQGIKALTPKPVVGVGRFTSPDLMVKQVKSGVLDFIGAARPSIADPFIPRKIDEGRIEDIRECIGCNICVTGDTTMSISRCTQNPTFMEEWRKGWHPERMNEKGESDSVLVIGAGPAGLEATRALGERGYQVALAEGSTELGGRLVKERLLPNLSAWGRVVDYRVGQIQKMPNVEVYLDSKLSADEVLEFGFENVAIATGSSWRRDGVARYHLHPIAIDTKMPAYTPDDIMDGKIPSGRIVIYDDDHYYMGGIMAELLTEKGCDVVLVTPAVKVSEWTDFTLEQHRIQKKLMDLGVEIHLNKAVKEVTAEGVSLECTYTGALSDLNVDAVVLVTARDGNDDLWQELKARESEWEAAGIKSIKCFGDAESPAPIAWATYAGHRYARELDGEEIGDDLPFRREITELAPD
ncbi:FAD-dependent oxidoreductase [Curvivirga sp.]|uniref:oxidoreductase n=1 Tax=Curvivirga sp. TaxID=2856848 RepID=UPI003B58E6D5